MNGSKSVLAKLGALWLVMMALLITVGWNVAAHAYEVDNRPKIHYSQPRWSEDESQIAYLSWAEGTGSSQKALWVGSRVDGKAKKILDLDNQKLTLLGWLDDDKRLLLLPDKAEGAVPVIWVVDVAGAKLQEVKFSRNDLEYVGVESGEVFFQRRAKKSREVVSSVHGNPTDPTPALSSSPDSNNPNSNPNAGLNGNPNANANENGNSPDSSSSPPPLASLDSTELELLVWSPGQNAITSLTSLPTEGEDMSIVRAVASPDNKKVAMVIRLKDELALWLYDREQNRTQFGNVRVVAREFNLAWSWDSVGLVVCADEPASSNLYVLWNASSGEVSTLRANGINKKYQPFWPRGEKSFLLVSSDGQVSRFDPEHLQSEKLIGRSVDGHVAAETTLSPRANWAVFRSQSDAEDRLYYYSFKSRQTRELFVDDQQLTYRNSRSFLVGRGLLNSYYWWTGQNVLLK